MKSSLRLSSDNCTCTHLIRRFAPPSPHRGRSIHERQTGVPVPSDDGQSPTSSGASRHLPLGGEGTSSCSFPFCSFPFEGTGDRRRKAAVEEVVEKNVLPFASDKVHAPTSSGASRHLPLIGEGAEPREIRLSHPIRQLPVPPSGASQSKARRGKTLRAGPVLFCGEAFSEPPPHLRSI